MGGIRYPKNWEKILRQPVFAENLREISCGEIRSALINEMVHMYYFVLAGAVDKKLCLALSGGIDSSILAAFMRLNNIPFTAITLGSGPKHPDVIYARLLAKQFCFEHRVFFPAVKSGKDAYNDLFSAVSSIGFRYVICADTVDEILGGYWEHINYAKFCQDESKTDAEKMEWSFEYFWNRLAEKHLDPMNHYAKEYGIEVILPYLAISDLLWSAIPSQRVRDGGNGKVILRKLGSQLGLPDEIINRPKLGLCDVWKEF